ncbi:DUF1361 domain-containing protein [Agrilactobacillus fermenti]|uniref:DUF1361 domain-containing protein n=1 Tax=Agrilactobacillus fermenti TaxID=2586909 RepID=UPI003A5C77A8
MNKSQIRWFIRFAYIFFLAFAFVGIKNPFEFIFLNTLLAYIPIEIAFHLSDQQIKSNLIYLLLLLIWLLFYPNTPYLLTDLFHLSLLHPYNQTTMLMRANTHLWLYFAYLVTSAIVSTILGFATMKNTLIQVNQRFFHGKTHYYPFLLELTLLLTAIGIYIGRFLRIHTVYLLDPSRVITPILHMWHPESLAFIAILWVIMNLIYLSIWCFNRLTKVE